MADVAAGRYEIVCPLAAGGMAQLYLAHPRGRAAPIVALKRILPHLAHDRVFVDMFLNEARVAATLHHPNLVPILDWGEEAGHYFLAMEYVHGADLGELLDSAAEADDLPLPVALTIVRDACAGLHHLHDQADAEGRPLELVHRDVSPSNILVRTDGAVKVTDFGIATATAHTRTTRPGTVKGKASYMAPEQCTGGLIDRRADVFALGIILYETSLLTRLFVGDNEFALMMQVVQGEFDRPRAIDPGYPASLEAIVMRALAAAPEDRYPTAAQMAVAIEACAAEHGIVLSSDAVAHWLQRRIGARPYPSAAAQRSVSRAAASRRGVAAAWVLAAAGIVGVAGLAAWTWSGADAPGRAAAASPESDPTAASASPRDEAASQPGPLPDDDDAELVIVDEGAEADAASAPEDPDAALARDPDDEEPVVVEIEPADDGPSATRRRRKRRASPATPSYDLDQAAPPR